MPGRRPTGERPGPRAGVPLSGAAAVRRGYGPPDDAFDTRVEAWAFAICITATAFRAGQGDPAGVAAALQRTRELLAEEPASSA